MQLYDGRLLVSPSDLSKWIVSGVDSRHALEIHARTANS